MNFVVTGVSKTMIAPGQMGGVQQQYGGGVISLGLILSPTLINAPAPVQGAAVVPIEVYAVALLLSGSVFGVMNVTLLVDKSQLAGYPIDGTGVWVSPGVATVPV